MTDTTGMVHLGSEDGFSRFFDIRTDSQQNEFEAKTIVTQDYVPTLRENAWLQVNGNNGWTKNRTMRRVAQIPTLALQLAKDAGWDVDDQNELRRFIESNPQWMTVKQFKAPSAHSNIIIK
jgi:hypothetical protein